MEEIPRVTWAAAENPKHISGQTEDPHERDDDTEILKNSPLMNRKEEHCENTNIPWPNNWLQHQANYFLIKQISL